MQSVLASSLNILLKIPVLASNNIWLYKLISVTGVSCHFSEVKFEKNYDGLPIACVIHKQEGWDGRYLFCVPIINYLSNHKRCTCHAWGRFVGTICILTKFSSKTKIMYSVFYCRQKLFVILSVSS